MRYWDIAQQLYPSSRGEIAATHWRRLVRHAWTLDLWVDISLIKPDVAHFWLDHSNIWGAPAALLAGVPSVILSTRNVSPVNFPYLYSPYMHPWYVWLSRCPRVHYINNSHAGAENYAEWMGVDKSAFEVVLNGVDLSHLHDATDTEWL